MHPYIPLCPAVTELSDNVTNSAWMDHNNVNRTKDHPNLTDAVYSTMSLIASPDWFHTTMATFVSNRPQKIVSKEYYNYSTIHYAIQVHWSLHWH